MSIEARLSVHHVLFADLRATALRKKAYEKKRRETELALLDKARGEDAVGESSVQLGLLSLSENSAVTESTKA